MHVRRLVPARSPSTYGPRLDAQHPYQALPQWDAYWIHPSAPPELPYTGLYQCQVTVAEPAFWRFSMTADERFECWVDGELVDRGPDRGDWQHWYYSTYEWELTPGDHLLQVRVWALGSLAPTAQITYRSGLLVAGEAQAHRTLSTGLAEWCWRYEPAWQFQNKRMVGPEESYDFRTPPGDWQPVVHGMAGNDGFEMYPLNKPLLAPSFLPPQRRESLTGIRLVNIDTGALHERLLAGTICEPALPIEIPPHTRRRLLFDLGKSVCGRLRIQVENGNHATIRSLWAEAAYFHQATPETAGDRRAWDPMKNRRDVWQNGFFRGLEDQWIFNGEAQKASTLWWRSGRFILLQIETDKTPIQLASVDVELTGYPFSRPAIETGNPQWDQLAAICLNTLEACAHETLMDCPHYEQLAYAGDARVQLKCWLAICPEETALFRHTLRHFWASTLNPGRWTGSSAPSRSCQTIPTFSLWWVIMAADYITHTHDHAFVRPMLPALRTMVERWFEREETATGLLRSPSGWNFLDWAFEGGVPPGGMPGEISTALNWLAVHALQAIATIEEAIHEPLLAQRWQSKRDTLAEALIQRTWDTNKGIFADQPGVALYSEQTQALALLTNDLSEAAVASIGCWLAGDTDAEPNTVRCQAFFSYYLFEACQRHGWLNQIERRLKPWWNLLESGFTTTPENFGVTRSDTHAWSAYPLRFVSGMNSQLLQKVDASH